MSRPTRASCLKPTDTFPPFHRMPLNTTEPFVSIPAEGVEIYLAPIVTDGNRHSRREAEKAATARLVTTLFGPGATVAHNPDGAPLLILPDGATPAPEISISHSIRTVALAVGRAGRHIGIDIEQPRQQLVRVAARFLAPEETAIHAASEENLLRAWTTKEAAFKAAGITGLTLADIRLDATASHALIPQWPSVEIRIRHFPGPDGSLMALAIRDK